MKTLYLLEKGMNDNNISTDIKNHRIRTVENIDIIYKGEKYNMFFEFCQGAHYNYRKTNKRTGAPLKKEVKEMIVKDGIFIDTQFERLNGTWKDGSPYYGSYRKSDLEREIFEKHYDFSRKSILEIINTYSVEKYDRIILIEEESKRIINKIGGFREKDIIKERDFQTDGSFFFRVGEIAWNEEHKTVTAYRQEWQPVKDGRKLVETISCTVDLVTKEICN